MGQVLTSAGNRRPFASKIMRAAATFAAAFTQVERLAKGLGVADSAAYTSETASYFWLMHVLSRWEQFVAKAERLRTATCVKDLFPFSKHFDDVQDLFASEAGRMGGTASYFRALFLFCLFFVFCFIFCFWLVGWGVLEGRCEAAFGAGWYLLCCLLC